MTPIPTTRPATPSWVTLGAVAAGYLLLSHLGYFLAIPPNHAVGVWPASGFALAATLAWGPRAAWGVWLGHWTFAFLGYLPGHAPLALTVGVPLGVATGSALQALAGRWLVHRVVGYPNALTEPKSLVAFFCVASPLACWIAPTFGTTTLILADRIAMGSFLPTWWAWWVGDALGLVLATPVFLLFLGAPEEIWRSRRWKVGLPLGLSLAAVVGTFLWVRAEESGRIQHEFKVRAQMLHTGLAQALGRHRQSLETLGMVLATSGDPGDEGFRKAVARLRTQGPALRGVAWIPRHGTARQDLFAGIGSAPLVLLELPSAQAMVEKAGNDLGFLLSAPHPVPQGTLSREELLMALPVPEGAGVLLASISIQGLWGEEDALLGRAQGLHARWLDITEPKQPRTLVAATARRSAWSGEQLAEPGPASPRSQTEFSLGGRTFRLDVWPTPEHLGSQQSRAAWSILILGSLYCAGLAASLLVEHRHASDQS